MASRFTNIIVKAADISIPKKKVTILSKPWWNKEIKSLRKTMLRLSRKAKALGYTLFKEELSNTKNNYFNTIKETKSKHWNSFLKKEDSQSIFKAISYTKDYTTNNLPSINNPITKEVKSTF